MRAGTAWLMWSIPAALFLVAFFHRNAPGVMARDLMETFGVTGAVIGLLSSTYFYSYAGFMIPGGLRIDAFGAPRAGVLARVRRGGARRARGRRGVAAARAARAPARHRPRARQRAHVARLSQLLLSLLRDGQPLPLGGAVPARRLRAGDDAGGDDRRRHLHRAARLGAAHGLRLRQRRAAAQVALRRPERRAPRRVGALPRHARRRSALGGGRPLLRPRSLWRRVRADVADRPRGEPARAGRHRRRRREPRRLPRRRPDPGPPRRRA